MTPGGPELRLSSVEGPASALLPEHLVEFWIENGRPVWRFEHDGIVLEKRIVLTYRQNTTRVSYRLIAAPGPVKLRLEPAVSMRSHEGCVDQPTVPYVVKAVGDGVEVTAPGHSIDGTGGLPPLRLLARTDKAAPMTGPEGTLDVIYRVERSRGYEWRGPLHKLGRFELTMAPGGGAQFTASTEAWQGLRELDADQAMALDDERRQRLLAQAHPVLQHGVGAELVLAADQFIITPRVRPADEARLHAEGDEARTIIAGYPWFTDWGRDTMISLEGLTLLTGRHPEARSILHTFAKYIRDGLIPNLFPEGETQGLYHTADATLWFFHALDRYERTTGDVDTRRFLMPKLVEIVEKHFAGTRFGIGLDPADGLLRQGAPGYQLTWMDAKVGDWVVTPATGQGRGDQRPLLQRAHAAGRLAGRRGSGRPARGLDAAIRDRDGRRPRGCASHSTGASGTRGRGACSTCWTASPIARALATTPASARTRCSPSRCRTRCWTAPTGSRS